VWTGARGADCVAMAVVDVRGGSVLVLGVSAQLGIQSRSPGALRGAMPAQVASWRELSMSGWGLSKVASTVPALLAHAASILNVATICSRPALCCF
jgi:hypothetical protein